MSQVPWKSGAIGSGLFVAAGLIALCVLLSHVDEMGAGDFYFVNVPFYIATWFLGGMALGLGTWAAGSVARHLVARSLPGAIDLALLIPALLVAYGWISWSGSAYRVFRARTTSEPEKIQALYDRGGRSERWLLKAMAGNPACPSELLTELAGLENLDDAWQGGLRDLLAGSRRSVVRLVALNPNTTPEVLRDLAHAGQWPEILSNPSTPLDVLREAMNKGQVDTRRRLAKGAAAREILEALSTDADRTVRHLVAENEAAPASALARLVKEPSDIRFAVARNPSTSQDTLKILSRDVSPSVREEASRRLREISAGNDNPPVMGEDAQEVGEP